MLAEDLTYIATHFITLDPHDTFGVSLPTATYCTPNGRTWFARDV